MSLTALRRTAAPVAVLAATAASLAVATTPQADASTRAATSLSIPACVYGAASRCQGIALPAPSFLKTMLSHVGTKFFPCSFSIDLRMNGWPSSALPARVLSMTNSMRKGTCSPVISCRAYM